MNKNLIAVFFVLLAAGLPSCKKDNAENPVTGTWELSYEHNVAITPTLTTDTTIGYSHGHSTLVIFTSGGRYTTVDQTGQTPDTSGKGTYSFGNGKMVILEDGTGSPDTVNATVSNNTLTLSGSDTATGYIYSYSSVYLRQ